MKYIVLSILIFTTSFTLSAQKKHVSRIDEYFDILLGSQQFMGSVAVQKGDSLLWTKSYGYSNVANQQLANAQTMYRIGSISKTYTAALIIKAADNNLIDLDQSIAKFFPGLKNAQLITVRMLLQHRSGIHNFTDDTDHYLNYAYDNISRGALLQLIKSLESDFQPGVKAAYSNSNYVLLSLILEEVYKMPYEVILQEQLIKPLQLEHTRYGDAINNNNNEAFSYHYENEKWIKEKETNLSIPLGAGGVIATADDLTKFIIALNHGKLISNESLAKMKEIKDGFGLGLFEMPFGSKKVYGHTGGIDGFQSFCIYYPDEDMAFAILSNGTDYNMNTMMIALASEYLKQPYELPVVSNFKISPQDLLPYSGDFHSEDIGLGMKIFVSNTKLFGQADGQGEFPLKATALNEFIFDAAGIKIKFSDDRQTFILYQGGGEFKFKKK